MGAALLLCRDYDGAELRRLAKDSGEAKQTRRLLTLAGLHDGGARGDAARIGSVGLQSVRDWVVVRFDEEAPDRLIHRKAPAAHPKGQAGWHTSKKLNIPGNVTLMPLPPRSLELNPAENTRQFMRDTWLSNRIFSSHQDIVHHGCFLRGIRALGAFKELARKAVPFAVRGCRISGDVPSEWRKLSVGRFGADKGGGIRLILRRSRSGAKATAWGNRRARSAGRSRAGGMAGCLSRKTRAVSRPPCTPH